MAADGPSRNSSKDLNKLHERFSPVSSPVITLQSGRPTSPNGYLRNSVRPWQG